MIVKTNADRWIDAAILILHNKDLEPYELVEKIHAETKVPKELLVDGISWHLSWGDTEKQDTADERLRNYLAEDDSVEKARTTWKNITYGL